MPADLSLSVALQRVAAGRRVVWVGHAEAAAEVLARSAAKVLVLDPDLTAPRAREPLAWAPLPLGSTSLAEGSFDLAVVPDARVFSGPLAERVEELSEIVGEDGLVVVGVAEHDYESVHALFSARFRRVRFFGQAPFSGWALGELAREPEDVSVDGSLLGEEETHPVRVIAFGSQREIPIESYAVVAVPSAEADVPLPAPTRVGVTVEVPTVPAPRDHADEPLEASWDSAAEVATLEAGLSEAAVRAAGLAREVERRGALLRDAIAQFAELSGPSVTNGASPSGLEELAAQRDRAVERALDAEAARAEALFRIDELEALLESLRGASAAASSPAPLDHAPEPTTGLQEELAELTGTVRGLRSRLAEVEEMRGLAEARYRLCREDLSDAEARRLELERTLGEMREQFELELIRSRGRPTTEAEVARIAALETSEATLRLALTEFEARNARVIAELEQTIAETKGLRARLSDREAALVASRARSVAAPTVDLEREVAVARDALAGRDELVNRLQIDLAEAEQGAREADARMRRLADENERLRHAVLDASNHVDDREAFEERARALASLLETQKSRLVSAVAARDGARSTLLELRRLLSELDLSSAFVESTEARPRASSLESSEELVPRPSENRVLILEQEARDRELLLRSLSAQLEERNDRIRALERERESMPGGKGADVEALQHELMQSQERAARLAEELEHARESLRIAQAERGAAVNAADADHFRLELDRRSADLDRVKARAMGFERDLRTVRQVCVETRHALEELLGSAAASGDPATAERIGAMLRMLDRV